MSATIPFGPVPTGPDGFAAMVDKWHAALSDFALIVDFMLAESPLVAARWTISATHSGPFAGIPASFRRIRFSGATVPHR